MRRRLRKKLKLQEFGFDVWCLISSSEDDWTIITEWIDFIEAQDFLFGGISGRKIAGFILRRDKTARNAGQAKLDISIVDEWLSRKFEGCMKKVGPAVDANYGLFD